MTSGHRAHSPQSIFSLEIRDTRVHRIVHLAVCHLQLLVGIDRINSHDSLFTITKQFVFSYFCFVCHLLSFHWFVYVWMRKSRRRLMC